MIPIQNVFYMYCYAWGKFPEGAALTTGAEDSPNLQSLLAEVLLRCFAEIERQGIDRSYVLKAEELKTVRGRIHISDTMNARIRDRVAIVCEHDDLSQDVPQNQILKSALKLLVSVGFVDRVLVRRLKSAVKRLSSVSDIRLTAGVFRQVRLNRNNAYYDLSLKICRLVLDRLNPAQFGDGFRFTDPASDETHMARVFEEFVRNFFKLRLDDFRVEALEMNWDAQLLSEIDAPALPRLRTDIFLRSAKREVIVDTKYYRETLQVRFERKTVRSAHLYQLLAYLANAVATSRAGPRVEGLLLYPTTNQTVHAVYEVHKRKIQICTINLNQDWPAVEADLLNLVVGISPAELAFRAEQPKQRRAGSA